MGVGCVIQDCWSIHLLRGRHVSSTMQLLVLGSQHYSSRNSTATVTCLACSSPESRPMLTVHAWEAPDCALLSSCALVECQAPKVVIDALLMKDGSAKIVRGRD